LPVKIIGNRKIIFAKMFCQKVNNKKIKKKDLDKKTIQHFEEVFEWIDLNLN